MTDNDKTALEEFANSPMMKAWEGFPDKEPATYSGFEYGWNAAKAHADEQHAERVRAAIELAIRYGGIDGAHHKMWVIDQMLRVLCGDAYIDTIREACDGEDGPNTYDWDTGIAP